MSNNFGGTIEVADYYPYGAQRIHTVVANRIDYLSR
jgi:hypothetical protein